MAIKRKAVLAIAMALFATLSMGIGETSCVVASPAEDPVDQADPVDEGAQAESAAPKSAKDAFNEIGPAYLAQLKECSQIVDSISGVDLCFDPSSASPRWIKLEVVGEKNAADTTGHFPSGWGIRAELAILNRGTEEAVITAGTKILTFTTEKENVNVIADSNLIVPARTGNTAGYSIVVAYFDSTVLKVGLSEISYVVNPDAEIAESNQENNEGTLKLFHPSAYPNIKITEVIVPDYVQAFGEEWDAYEITVKGKNFGGKMTRTATVHLAINNRYGYYNWTKLKPLGPGGDFTHIYKIKRGLGENVNYKTREQIPVEVRISDDFNEVIGPYSWGSLINTDLNNAELVSNLNAFVPWVVGEGDDYLASPIEIGSEAVIMGTSSTYGDPVGGGSLKDQYGDASGHGVPTPEDYDGDAVYHAESFKLARPVPHLIYPHNDQDFSLTDYPPVLPEDWISFCIPESATSLEFVEFERLFQRWVHPCFGISKDGVFPDSLRVRNWPDSLLRFRWLPTSGNTTGYEARLQVRDAGNTLIHEVALNPEFTGILDGTFTGLGIDEFQTFGDASGIIKGRSYDDIYDYALNVRDHDKEKAKKEAKEGIFNQYVYDGPPLEPGDYYWRVTYDINAEEGSEIWSEEFKFTIQAHDLSPGQSLRLKDTDLASGISVSGEVVNVYPGGFTLATEQGFVNLRTDTDTVIHSNLWSPSDPNAHPDWTGLYTAVPLSWKAWISMDEPPYIVGKALVPYESIPVVNSVVRRIVLNGHTTCTVVGQTDTGKIAVSCHAGDYMELNAVDVPADADKIVFIRAYKECEVMEISSEGPAQLECEDGVTMTLDESLKKGQVILVPGKSPKLISDATHLHEHITEFGIHATSMNDQGFTAVLESYGLQSDESSDVGFEQTMAEASPEVQEYLQTITLFHDMVADIPLSLISDDNDFIFDASDIYTLEEQLEKVVGSYEYIVDLMVNEGLNNLSKETRDEVIANIKSQSTQLHPWSELKTKLTEAVYFLGQRNLIEFVSVMDGTMKK